MSGLEIVPTAPPKGTSGRCLPPPGDVLVLPCDPAGKVVAVSLFGRHGVGRMMTLDADGWERASEITTRWIVLPSGPLRYVAHGARSTRVLARQRCASPVLLLARFLAGAGPNEAVCFRDSNTFNLTAGNLEVVSKAEQQRRRGVMSWKGRRAKRDGVVGGAEGSLAVH